ncbi:MAG: YgiQ family radical SAM protein, partial [Clostridia bacterium]|nr:YgiQ family radical SAM protein [Clostridia bacterium]
MDKKNHNFMPVSRADMERLGIDQLDFVYIIGDAYIDHPSFGPAIISRVLQDKGYTVGIISQPDWHSAEDFKRLGRPRLGFLISSGNIDSMVNHYTVAKKRRTADAYTPGGEMGRRPDRAVIVYANRAREAYRGVPILIGGIEASLRRFAHYDYWDDKVRRSILWDSGADLLMYGMGERVIAEVADALDGGLPVEQITYIPGTCCRVKELDSVYDYQLIPGFDEVSADKKAYCEAFMAQYREQDPIRGRRLVQPHGDGYLVANPPAMPLSEAEMDHVYGLPYTRLPHPSYKQHIPAMDEIEFSITSCRGCFGACSFCAL